MSRRPQGYRVLKGRRGRSWSVRFRCNGNRIELSTGEREPEAAARAAASIYTAVTTGASIDITCKTPVQLDELCAKYLEHTEASGSLERFKMQLVHCKAHVLRLFTSVESLASVAAWQDYNAQRRKETASTTTVAKEISTIRSFARWLHARDFIKIVPTFRAPKPVSDYKSPHLDPASIRKVIQCLPAAAQPLYLVMWCTALRPGALRQLRIDDYDGAQHQLRIRASIDKARYGRVLPLSKDAWSAIEKVVPSAGVIFGCQMFRRELKEAALAAGLPKAVAERITPKVIRHSRLTHLTSTTKDMRSVAYIAGHRNLSTTSGYVHGDVDAAARVLALADADAATADVRHTARDRTQTEAVSA